VSAALAAGDLPPAILTPPPGPRSRALAATLRRVEAPGVNAVPLTGEPPIAWAEARGANVLDVDGNRYVDLTAGFGVAAIGHRHPRVAAAIAAQAERLIHGLGDVHPHPGRAALAARLAALSPVPDAQVYFAISGAEAVEIAVKTALAVNGSRGRPGVLAFEPAYHGLTLGALAATSRPEFRAPFAAHLHPHVHRLPFGAPAADLAAALDRPGLGAAIVEPVVGREGVLFPPPGWLAELGRLCRERGVLLVADEIFTGFGRTGDRFVVEREGVVPDLLCCGKALGGGLPIAAVLGRRELFRAWERDGEALHTATFVAHPLACAAAAAALDVMDEERLAERAAALGEAIAPRLAAWSARYPAVAAVRGRGLLWGIEMRTREDASRWVRAALRRGVLMLAGGPAGKVAQIVPPLTIARPQLDGALELLEAALDAA
jgi:acetylornithine/succinyldiaminopimelate/putrescine aminotransferase